MTWMGRETSNVWDLRCVLVTGGAGFIGSHLCEWLQARGSKVLVLDDFSTGREQNLAPIAGLKRVNVHRGCAQDHGLVNSLVSRATAVVHLASAVGVMRVLEQPARSLWQNLGTAQTVLAACAEYSKPIVVASSSEVYGDNSQVPYAETLELLQGATLGPRWSYACSKAMIEGLAQGYHRETGNPVLVLRLFNTTGPRQRGDFGMVLPRLVEQALRGQRLTVFGSGQQTRAFAHVRDVVYCLGALLELGPLGFQVVNVGNDEEISIRDLADRVARLLGAPQPTQLVSYEEAYGQPFDDMMRRVPDLSKLERMIGRVPRTEISQIILDVADSLEKDLSARS